MKAIHKLLTLIIVTCEHRYLAIQKLRV